MLKGAKTTPWTKIKTEYLQGVTPKELSQKYDISARTITNKASREKWTIEKSTICDNLRQNAQDRIKDLTNIALDALVDVINSPDCKNAEKIAAARAILDVSGLKSVKQDLTVKEVPMIIDDI